MIELKELIKLTNSLIVLYAEDQPEARMNIESILKKFFQKVVIAENGEEGVALFKQNHIDLIITDIRMPKMDGLEMVREIRKINKDVPVIVTTAFNDTDYLVESIEAGVDKYIIKPIDKEMTLNALYNISKRVTDRKKAEEYEQRLIQEKVNKSASDTLKNITNAYPNPSILFEGNEIKFINSAFRDMFDSDTLGKLFLGDITLSDLFEKKDDFLTDLNLIDKDISKNKISIQTKDGKRKIYLVIKREVNLNNETNTNDILYTFNDITLSEYQKVKIKNYTKLLEDYVFNLKYQIIKDKAKDSTNLFNDEEPKATLQTNIKKEKLSVDKRGENLLRREHHKSVTNASEYIESLDEDVLNDVNELIEVENEIEEMIDAFEKEPILGNLKSIAIKFNIYTSVILNLFEFEGLAYGIKSLVSLLENAKEEDLNEKNIKKIVVFLRTIKMDLKNWRVSIFELYNVPDIHYLDSSMLSSILQLEVIFTQVEIDDSDEDLDIFF